MRRKSSNPRGFTLLEVGIVIAVVAVLAAMVLLARGFRDSARAHNALQLLKSIRDGAQKWAQRNNAGLHYAGISAAVTANGWATLPGVPSGIQSPWNDATVRIQEENTTCTGNTCITICMGMPADDQQKCLDLVAQLSQMPWVVSAVCNNAGSPADCGLGGKWKLVLITR
jgi:prepilin-type N-terminal cleavage/methylation domain-containing protein